jgi:hypothetical protein
MATANPLWDAPRIHAELQKLEISVSQATVAKYMPRRDKPPSQRWRTFLANHVGQIMAADFFVVPTVTSCCAKTRPRADHRESAHSTKAPAALGRVTLARTRPR